MLRAFAIVHICMHKGMIKILSFTVLLHVKLVRENTKSACLVISDQQLFLELYR